MIAWLLLKAIKGSLLVYDVAFVVLYASPEDRALFRTFRRCSGGRAMSWQEKHKVVMFNAAATRFAPASKEPTA